jgi:hypothetical protein
MIIEKGNDKDNIECWFLLDNANLVGIFYTYEEALNFKNNG